MSEISGVTRVQDFNSRIYDGLCALAMIVETFNGAEGSGMAFIVNTLVDITDQIDSTLEGMKNDSN